MSKKELVMYSRSTGCPFVTTAKRVLSDEKVVYREIFIDHDPQARQRVLAWTGFLSVPTLVVAAPGTDLPLGPVTPLAPGASPRGLDRGPMLTEATSAELRAWLLRHGLIE